MDTQSPTTANQSLDGNKKALVATNIVMWVVQGLYTVSPIDLIPDFIPVLGWMDDLLGLIITVAFTVYTVSVVYKRGIDGLLPGKPDTTPTNDALAREVESDEWEVVPAQNYEPMSIQDIKAL